MLGGEDMLRRILLWAVAAMIIAVAAPAMAGPADWQAAATNAAALLGGTPAPAVDAAAALAAGPDDANYWLAVGLTVKSGADEDYWLPVLINGQSADGSWGSALGSAGAVIGLAAANATAYASQIAAGSDSLAAAQNADGSWVGDARDAYALEALKAALAGAGYGTEASPQVAITAPLEGACIQPPAIFPISGVATDAGADMNRTVVVFDSTTVQDITFANTATRAISASASGGVVAASPGGAVRAANVVTITTTAAHGLTGGSVTIANAVPVGSSTIAASPGGAVRAANVVTITTMAAHGLAVGNSVVVQGVTAVGATNFNGTFTIATVPTATTFTYAQTAAADTGGGGSCGMNFNGTFTIATVPSPTTFTYAQTGPDDAGGGGSWAYDATAVAEGAHSVSITAYDAGALWGVDLNNFMVDATNPSTVAMGALSPVAIAGGTPGPTYPATCLAATDKRVEISRNRIFGLYYFSSTGHDAGCGLSSIGYWGQRVRVGFGVAPPAGALTIDGIPKWAGLTGAGVPTAYFYANYAAQASLFTSSGWYPGCTTANYSVGNYEMTVPQSGTDYMEQEKYLPLGNSAGFPGPLLAPTLAEGSTLTRTIAAAPGGIVRAGNIVTITTTAAHDLSVNDSALMAGVGTTPIAASPGGAVRAANVVTITTTAVHGAAVGSSAVLAGVTHVGTPIAASPGGAARASNVVTITTTPVHGLALGNSVVVANVVVGTPIAASPGGAVRGGPANAIAASPGGAVRASNVVTITTTAAHNFVVGDRVTVAGVVPVGVTNFNGTFVVTVVPSATTFRYAQTAANDTGGAGTCNYNRVTITTTVAHNLLVGNSVVVAGVVPVWSGPIAASPGGAVRAANVVTITTGAAHGLAVGESVVVAGVVPVGATVFNGTFTIATVPSATTFTYAQTAANDTGGAGTCSTNFNGTFTIVSVPSATTFTYAQTARADTGGGGTYGLNFNGTFTITGVPSATTFTYAQTGPNGSGGGGTCGMSFNGTFTIASVPSTTTFTFAQTGPNSGGGAGTVASTFLGTFTVTRVPSATTFTYDQVGADFTGGGGTCAAPAGTGMAAGKYWYAVAFVGSSTLGLRDETKVTSASPLGSITLAAASRVRVLNVETSPSALCTARWIYRSRMKGATHLVAGLMARVGDAPRSNLAGSKVIAASPTGVVRSGNLVTVTTTTAHNLAIDGVVSVQGVLPGGSSAKTIAASPGGAVRAANVVTITTTSGHGLAIGQSVVVTGVVPVGATNFNGTFAVTSVPTSTTFTYAQTAANDTGGGGSCGRNLNGIFTITQVPSATTFRYAQTAPNDTGGGGTCAAPQNYLDNAADLAIGWPAAGSPVMAPYVDIDADLTPMEALLGMPPGGLNPANCGSNPTDPSMRGQVMAASCGDYNTLKTFARFWPSRGRYGPIALKVRATDFAGRTLDSGTTNVTVVVPIFTDVQTTDWAWDQVERIRNFKPAPRAEPVTAGTGSFPADDFPLKRFFSPDGTVNRTNQVVFIIRALGIQTDPANYPGCPTTSPFMDVAVPADLATADSGYRIICKAFELGITQGCFYNPGTGQRKFCPGSSVTRAEMVTFLLRALGQGVDNAAPQEFADVPSTHWAYGMIQRGYRWDAPGDGSRILEGCKIVGGSKYACPDEKVQRRQMAVFLCRAFVVPAVPVGPSDPW
jgi:protein involved in ribonucleotide reduction